jgi:tetratricopeptide (TPR) repeat protein
MLKKCGLFIFVLCANVVLGQSTPLYELTPEDLKRMQERSEALRLANQPGWEQGYIAIAKAEWKEGERMTALARFLTTMRETTACEHRASAFRACSRLIEAAAADHPDAKEYLQQREQFSFHSRDILLGTKVNQESMGGGCAIEYAAMLATAAHLWEHTDQGSAERAAESMLQVAEFLPSPQSAETKVSAKLVLSRISEKRGKYEAAYAAYDEAFLMTDFQALGEERTLVREIMLNERVRLLALSQPGKTQMRTTLAERVVALRTLPLPWQSRAELLGDLLSPLSLEAMTNERIDALIFFVQSAPPIATATSEESSIVLDFVSTLQAADHPSINRGDAAIFAYDVLIQRAITQAERDRYTAIRNELAQRLGQ